MQGSLTLLIARLLILPLVALFTASIYAGQETELVSARKAVGKTYPEHLSGAFTGGFGEDTCRRCHFDYELNPGGGRLGVSGIPKEIPENKSVEITIMVERQKLKKAGFQLSARFEDGTQAGRFKIAGRNRLMFTDSAPDSVQYVQHSQSGSTPNQENKARWLVTWLAPESPGKPVIFNVAANAGNGDQSEFGDFIYAKEIRSKMR